MILSRIMPTYLQLFFEKMIFRNSFRNGTTFYYQRRKIPSDEILERLYKVRKRESEKLKTVLELYNMEIHQKKAGPDYHRLKTIIAKKYRAEFENEEFKPVTEIMKQAPWSIIRE